MLNPTAVALWPLCDGSTTPRQAANRLAERTALTAQQAEELIVRPGIDPSRDASSSPPTIQAS